MRKLSLAKRRVNDEILDTIIHGIIKKDDKKAH